MRIPKALWIPAAVAAVVTTWAAPTARAEEGQTVAAARIALQREFAAREEYLAYAARADEECCEQAAALFRALATAEDVHVRNHAWALEQLGVTPTTDPVRVEVGTTPENLQAAIDGEVFERRVAYRQFMGYARDECLYDVLASFRWARDAEVTHAIRLSLALAQFDYGRPGVAHVASSGEDAAGIHYFVCMGCGCVRTEAPAGHCDCGTASTQCAIFTGPEPTSMPELMSGRP